MPTEHDIKTAYRKLAQIHHPDKNGSQTTFNTIKDAHDLLMNEIHSHQKPDSGKKIVRKEIQLTIDMLYYGAEYLYESNNGVYVLAIPIGATPGDTLTYSAKDADGTDVIVKLTPMLPITDTTTLYQLIHTVNNKLNIRGVLSIPVYYAMVGKTVELSDFGGVTVTIPKGTNHGTVIRVDNHPNKNVGVIGDLEYIVRIQIPKVDDPTAPISSLENDAPYTGDVSNNEGKD